MERKIDVEKLSKELFDAVQKKESDKIKLLLNSGADVTYVNENGDNVFHVAAKVYKDPRLLNQELINKEDRFDIATDLLLGALDTKLRKDLNIKSDRDHMTQEQISLYSKAICDVLQKPNKQDVNPMVLADNLGNKAYSDYLTAYLVSGTKDVPPAPPSPPFNEIEESNKRKPKM